MLDKLAKRIKERGVAWHVADVRGFMIKYMNQMLLFQLLMPCFSSESLHDALHFCASRAKIEFSGHKEFWPMLKPLLLELPGVKMKELPVLTAIQLDDKETLALLLQADADPDYERGHAGVSALNLAVEMNQGEDVVRMLLSAKADCNLKLRTDGKFPAWKNESTALHQACMLSDACASERMVALLMEHGCNLDISIKNRQKKTAFDIARHVSVKEMLNRSQKESKSSKKKKQSQSTSSNKPPSCSPVSRENIQTGMTPDLPADRCQDKPRKETKRAPSIEERLMELKALLEQKAPRLASIHAEGDRTAIVEEETKISTDDIAPNESCTKRTSTAVHAHQSVEVEKPQALPCWLRFVKASSGKPQHLSCRPSCLRLRHPLPGNAASFRTARGSRKAV